MRCVLAAVLITVLTGIGLTRVSASDATDNRQVRQQTANTDCSVLTVQDASNLFGETTIQNINVATETDQIVFASQTTSAVESVCAFVPTASKAGGGYSLQYYIDQPNQLSASDWQSLWDTAKSAATKLDIRVADGVGDDAFYRSGDLMVRIGTYYLTVHVQTPDNDTETQTGITDLVDSEKPLAVQAATRLPSLPLLTLTTDNTALATPTSTPNPTAPLFTLKSQQTMVDWAKLMVARVTPDHTSYMHTTGPVLWGSQNAADYISDTDCSGFFMALLRQTYTVTNDDLYAWLGKHRPQAATFYDNVVAQHGFLNIQRLTDVQPGDLIAVKYLPGSSDAGDDTGHMMLVVGAPVARKATKPEIPNTQQWDIPIIDQSVSGHGVTDTRHLPDKKYRDGVGQGLLRVYTDKQGALIGYTWSDLSVSVYYDQSMRLFAIGRLDPQFKLN